MKRSEMIKEITKFLFDYTQLNGNDAKVLSVKILDMMEFKGMKPPIKKRCAVLLTDTHVWEDENA